MNKYKMRQARKEAGKTQEQAANILNTTQKQISKWELQTQDITLQKAIILAEYYNVSLDYIAGRTNYKRGIGHNKNIKHYEQSGNDIAIMNIGKEDN